MRTDYIKICFRTDPADWHGSENEFLWARPLGRVEETDVFELQNSPFYVRGVSYLDVVRTINIDGLFEFAGVVARSGHSTYRIIFEEGLAASEAWWDKLQNLGCTYESGEFQQKKLFSVDVPESAEIYAVYDILEQGESSGVWIFEEGHVGHPLGHSRSQRPNA